MKEPKRKIASLSRFLKIVFLIAACCLPIMNAGYWITEGYPLLKPWIEWDLLPNMGDSVKPLSEMNPKIKFFGFLVTLLPTAMNMLAFMLLAKLFHSFEKLEIFSQNSVKCVRKLGICIFVNQLIHPFYMAILSITLTISNPPGHRLISVGFGSEQLNLLVIGAIIILISWVMDEGRKLQEEQAATI